MKNLNRLCCDDCPQHEPDNKTMATITNELIHKAHRHRLLKNGEIDGFNFCPYCGDKLEPYLFNNERD